jgi:hypothetical protein
MKGQTMWNAVKKVIMEKVLFGSARNTWEKVYNVLVGNGPGMVKCIAGEAMKDLDKEIKNLNDFEKGDITSSLDMPSFGKLVSDSYPVCRAQNFWGQVKTQAAGWACFVISWVFPPLRGVCNALKFLDSLFKAINLLLTVISLLLLLDTYNQALKDIALSRERINMQLSASNIMGDYAEKLANTMDTLATGLATNFALANVISPSYSTVKLAFVSDRTGVLANDAEICSGDKVTIDYDFSKLNQTENFQSVLYISSSSHSKTLHFEKLSGMYGPYDTDELLGTNPLTDASEPYVFTLVYLGNKKLDYKLNYVNHACG